MGVGGKGARAKGSAAEREVVAILQEAGYPAHRTPLSGALEWMKGDITGMPGFHIEVKRCEALRISEWMKKAGEEADDKIALLIFRRSREPWRVCLDLGSFLRLVER